MRPDWRQAIPQEDGDILRDYETYIPEIADEVGIAQVLDCFEASSTLPIRIGTRQQFELTDATLADATLALENLYRERVLLRPPKPAHPDVDVKITPSRSTILTVLGRLTFWRLYKVFWAVAITVVMAALLLLQRHFLLQRYSQISKPTLAQQVELPNPGDISDLPLTSIVKIEPSYMDTPVLLHHPAIRARREKAPARRQFDGDVTIDVPPPASQTAFLPAAPALGIAANAKPQPPLPIPLPTAAPYPPGKQNRFLHFFSTLFHDPPQKRRADDEHNQKHNGQEIEPTAGSTGRPIQGLR